MALCQEQVTVHRYLITTTCPFACYIKDIISTQVLIFKLFGVTFVYVISYNIVLVVIVCSVLGELRLMVVFPVQLYGELHLLCQQWPMQASSFVTTDVNRCDKSGPRSGIILSSTLKTSLPIPVSSVLLCFLQYNIFLCILIIFCFLCAARVKIGDTLNTWVPCRTGW